MRPDWNDYFYNIAKAVAQRATCPRSLCGAVIVNAQNHIVSTGYNGSPPGEPHCIDDGCILEDNHCQRALHAEVNAVANAARAGHSVSGSRIYIYTSARGSYPCRECEKVLKAADIVVVRRTTE